MEGRGIFVAADIKGTDDDALTSHRFNSKFVNVELFFFAWKGISSHVNEFTAEKTDAFSVVLKDSSQIGGRGDVGSDFNPASVFRFTRDAFELLQELFESYALILFFFHDRKHTWCRFKINCPGEAVYNSGLSIISIVYIFASSYNGRNTQSAGKDGRMRCRCAFFCDEAQDLAGIHLYGFTWCQVVSIENAWFIGGEKDLLLAEYAQKNTGNFLHVRNMSLHVGIRASAVNLDKVLLSLSDRIFCVDALVSDNRADGINKGRTCQHMLIDLENEGVVQTYMGYGFLIELLHFGTCCVSCRIKTSHFSFRAVYRGLNDIKFLMTENFQRSDGYHSRNTFTTNF